MLRWHVNHGWGPADSIPVSDIAELRRPAVLPLVLEELETPRALGLAVLAEARQAVQIRTKSQLPPGAHLHVLAIGVSQYNEKARQLQLAFAAADAHDLAEALVNTQGSLYAAVTPQLLLNQDANKAGILQALATLRDAMAKGTGQDLAVVQFAGHAAVVDGKLYLLPYEVDARGAVRIKATGLSAEELRSELLELAKYGRVLVLLDACHSGTATMDGTSLAVDATALRAQLAAANVTVLTSSSSTEPSREDPLWKHGAFTKVFLDALDGAADTDHNGLISVIELVDYLTKYVAWITNWKQTPGIEVRFQSIVFANAR